ncbi:DUF3747 domain-containing protein [Cyanobium sp. CH-040]|uniref:DUF3747 domain-containing protein n=1 Tax=Cyanobium sp. CH-040 TaxID=2823708 RepID=UPI0020CCECB8|nr:DUF3747 domain-containing protein [Cyanobium sp. CH-040]MCP9928324.1 DUF3747 domain-containing protein [Cyanobium sp. CH-040]
MSLRFPAPSIPSIRFGRRHLAAAAATALLAPALPQQLARAAAPFGSTPVEADRVIALAQPLSGGRWNLVVLEQLQPAPPCWRRNADGTVDSFETHQPASVCGRFASSNDFSLRIAGDDLRHPWRLRLESRNDQLELLATSPESPTPLVVGSGPVAGDRPVALDLADGWTLERRQFEGRSLNHLYLSNAEPLPVLLARANAGNGLLLGRATPPPPPPSPLQAATSLAAAPRTGSRLSRLESLRLGRSADRSPAEESGQLSGSGVIALQVVPYRP